MKNIYILLMISFAGTCCFGQNITPQVVNTTGGFYQKDYFMMEWSVGELAITNNMEAVNGNYWLTNGFIQSLTDKFQFGNISTAFDKKEIFLFPNPTKDILEVDILTDQTGAVNLQLYNAVGQLLTAKDFYLYGYGGVQKMDMRSYKAGSYILKIEFKSFQGAVIKQGSFPIIKI